jgi:hypothetical protein
MGQQARNLDCRDCDRFFAFSPEEHGLCAELGYDQPSRCPACRRSLETLRRAIRPTAFVPSVGLAR